MKKYILKPGIHQFAPGSAAVHSNDNLTDDEAEWYLQRYPHIATLFIPQPNESGVSEVAPTPSTKVKRKRIPAKSAESSKISVIP
jgi:hypothetical protein